MAYNAVSQADHDLPSDSDDSRGPSPQAHAHSAPFEQNADHIDGAGHMQPAEAENSVQSLGSMIRLMRAPSYDVVEGDDYEVVADPSTGPDFNSPSSPNVSPPRLHMPDTPPTEDRAELRTPTTEHSVPLSHPTPGLQSLQGAYLHNVERLEKSAERLSLSSADIGSEIRRMDLEQRRRASSAGSASIYTSQDGLSHRDSMQSGTRLAQLSEHHALEEFPENRTAQSLAHSYLPPLPDPVPLTTIDINQNAQYHAEMGQMQMERPSSVASGDTYRQARVLFNDFDGVHYVPLDKGLELARQLSLTRPPLAVGAESHKQPQEGKDMVFYPAPVPMMLNLPPKLSQRPGQTEREKRRTQLLDAVAADNRKSAPYLSEQGQAAGNDRRQTKQLSDLPPHLRASVFFEAPSASLDIDHTQTSAVATLDSILDASTTAPVTAFTDHPFAGPLRPEMYSSAKHGKLPKSVPKDPPRERNRLRRKSALDLVHQPSGSDLRSGSPATHNLYPSTEAEAVETHERSSLRRHNSESDSSGSENSEESSSSEEDTDGDNDEQLQFVGQPATLLAELEKRKHDLKQRRRTAANVVGMQSTLLELDAVAAKQSEHRRQKRIALAWEHPEAAHHNDEDEDEDVPLGMLFPDKSHTADEARPLGLMEKREVEEGEPLSRRRARLRGEPLPQILDRRPITMHPQTAQSALALNQEDDSGEEGETLGQRLRRLKGHERNVSKADTDFTTELLAEFDHLKEDESKDNQNEPSQEDETLAERRARLKKEALEKRNSGLKIPRYRKSMADIFPAPRPSTAGQQSLLQEVPGPQGLNHQRSFDNRMSMQQFPPGPPKTSAGFSQYRAASLAGPHGYQTAHPNTFYSDAILGNGNLSYAVPPNMHANTVQQPVNPGQRAVIDRWRQSIV